jgi:hypothetical protein
MPLGESNRAPTYCWEMQLFGPLVEPGGKTTISNRCKGQSSIRVRKGRATARLCKLADLVVATTIPTDITVDKSLIDIQVMCMMRYLATHMHWITHRDMSWGCTGGGCIERQTSAL